MLSNFDYNNLVSFRGDDLGIKVSFEDMNDAPINITGWTIFLTIKKTRDDKDAVAVVKMDESDIPNPTLGELLIVIPSSVTVNLKGSYWYDIQIKKADNTIQTITHGSISFERDVTRRNVPE